MRRLVFVRNKRGIFIFRRKVPPHLQAFLKQREIIRSLGRCDPRRARLQAARLWITTERLFTVLSSIPPQPADDLDLVTPAQIKLFVDTMLAWSEFNDEYTSSNPEIEKHNSVERWLLQLELAAKRSRAALVKNEVQSIVDEMQEIAAQLQIPIRRGSKSEVLIGRAMLRAEADYYERQVARERKERGLPSGPDLNTVTIQELEAKVSDAIEREFKRGTYAVQATPTAPNHRSDSPSSANPRLAKLEKPTSTGEKLDPDLNPSQVWHLFLDERRRAGKKETASKLTSSLALWQKLHGDIQVRYWNAEMADRLRRLFQLLPSNYATGKEWRSFPKLSDIADEFQQQVQNAATEAERLVLMRTGTKHVTWNRHLSTLTGFWEWAKVKELTAAVENPFKGLFIETDEDDDVALGGSEDRLKWKSHQIKELFASPLYTGCKSRYRRHTAGPIVIRDALYWVPLILAYTGMRREEICQLRVEHLCRDDTTDIWYFDLKAKGLRLKKTKKGDSASKRWVPMPDALIELGIIEALYQGRASNEQLFPELYKSKRHDTFGDKLGKDFGRYRVNYDTHREKALPPGTEFVPLYERLRDLHSFRHSVCTDLINLHVPQAFAEEYTGHKSEARKTAFANYDKGRTLEILKEAIERRSLPIDISRLLAAARQSGETAAIAAE